MRENQRVKERKRPYLIIYVNLLMPFIYKTDTSPHWSWTASPCCTYVNVQRRPCFFLQHLSNHNVKKNVLDTKICFTAANVKLSTSRKILVPLLEGDQNSDRKNRENLNQRWINQSACLAHRSALCAANYIPITLHRFEKDVHVYLSFMHLNNRKTAKSHRPFLYSVSQLQNSQSGKYSGYSA